MLDARVGREAKLGVADGDRLAQALANRRDAGLDGVAIGVLDDEREHVLAELAEIPHPAALVASSCADSRASAVLMICSETRVAMICAMSGDPVDIEHGDGDGTSRATPPRRSIP